MECPHGFIKCIKTCNTTTCGNTCPYSEVCCKEYCFFFPGTILSRIQQGKVDHYPYVEEILKADNDGVLSILVRLGQVKRDK